jgi:hypothetical protein
MWRGLICLGVGILVAGAGMAQERPTNRQERQTNRDIRKGQVVRVFPDRNTVMVRVGTGADAKEYEYKVTTTTKYWGTDRRPLTEGLRYQQFRDGTNVWFIVGAGDQNQTVSELWFYDPGQQPSEEQVVYLQGKIIRVDPATGMVVVRTGTGDAVKEYEYKVDTTTRYWGPEQQVLTDGLRYQGFREGTQVWYRVGPGDRNRVISEVRFHDPGRRPILPRRKP